MPIRYAQQLTCDMCGTQATLPGFPDQLPVALSWFELHERREATTDGTNLPASRRILCSTDCVLQWVANHRDATRPFSATGTAESVVREQA